MSRLKKMMETDSRINANLTTKLAWNTRKLLEHVIKSVKMEIRWSEYEGIILVDYINNQGCCRQKSM